MKKILSVFLAFALLFVLQIPTFAMDVVRSGTYGGNIQWTLDSSGQLTLTGRGDMADNVTNIDRGAFNTDFTWYWYDLPWYEWGGEVKSVVIEDGITSIGNGVFFRTNPESVRIAASVSRIGDWAFRECSGLKEIAIPNGVTTIGASAFEGCLSADIFIPASVTSMGEGAMNRVASLTVDEQNPAFCTVDGFLFSKDMTHLISCPSSLSGDCVIPSGVTCIDSFAFYESTALTSVTLPSSVRDIRKAAFANCRALTDIVVPSGVRTIGREAFYRCENAKSIHLPDTVTELGIWAFYGCDNVKDIYYGGSEKQWNQIRIINKGQIQNLGDAMSSPYFELYGRTLHFNNKTDLPSAWAADEVLSAIAIGLVPENLQRDYTKPSSRGNVAQMFINLMEQCSGRSVEEIMEEKGVWADTGAFTDTSDNAVLAANALGIIYGTGDSRFSPDATLTRAQIAAILNRMARVLGFAIDGYSHNFTDVSGHWVDSELGWPSSVGIINGVGNNRFSPDTELTTEQIIAITYRAWQVLK